MSDTAASSEGGVTLPSLFAVSVNYDGLEGVLRDLLSRVNRQEGEISELKKTDAEKTATISSMQSNLARCLENMDTFASTQTDIKTSLSKKNSQIETLTETVQDQATRISDLEMRLRKAEKEAKEQAEHAKSQFDELSERETASENHVEKLEKTVEELKGLVTSPKEETPVVNDGSFATIGDLNELSNNIALVQVDVDALKEKIANGGLDASMFEARRSSTSDHLSKQIIDLQTALADHEVRLAEIGDKSLQTKRDITANQNAINELSVVVERNSHSLFTKGLAVDVTKNKNDIQALRSEFSAANASEKVERLVQEQQVIHTELEDRTSAMGRSIKEITLKISSLWQNNYENTKSSFATEQFCNSRFSDLKAQIDKLNRSVKKKVAGELKIFERDLQDYLADELSGLDELRQASRDGETTKGAVGRTHFKCLTCDNVIHSVAGPSTEAFKQATLVLPQPVQEKARQLHIGDLVVESGKAIDVVGPSGEVYRGRTEGRIFSSKSTGRPRTANSSRTSEYSMGTPLRVTHTPVGRLMPPENVSIHRPMSAPHRKNKVRQ